MARVQVAPNLFVKDKGSEKYYVGRFYVDGKQVERSFGNVKVVSLREAKMALQQSMSEPIKPKASGRLTFAEAVPLALKDIALVKQYKGDESMRQWNQTMNDYVIPHIGDIDVEDITREHVLNLLMQIWFDIPVSANRIQGRIEAILAWCIRRGYRKSPNCATWKNNLEFDLPNINKVRPPKHHEAPTIDELKIAVQYCLSHPSPVSGAMLMGIATSVRISEVLLAEPGEIDGDTWHCPVDRRKVAVPNRVPLSTLAMKALEMAQNDKYIFSARAGKPVAVDSPRSKLRMIVGRPVTFHGIRSTFKDWCTENGKDDLLSEKSLMHVTGDKSYRAYQRSDLLERRRVLMQEWADFLMNWE